MRVFLSNVGASLVVLSLVCGGGLGWLTLHHQHLSVVSAAAHTTTPRTSAGLGSVHVCRNVNYDQSLTCIQDDRQISKGDLDAGNNGSNGAALVIEVPNGPIDSKAVAVLFKVGSGGQTDEDGYANITLNQASTHTGLILKAILDGALGNASSNSGPFTLQDGATYVLRVDEGSKLVYEGEIGVATFTYHAS